jgi:hypothetical protein
MITLDLRQQTITVDELFQLASADSLLVRNRDGGEFVVETADAFDREVAELRQSDKFMAFLGERCKEKGSVTLEDIERRLAQAGP